MKTTSAIFLGLLAVVSASPTSAEADWKYEHGWDGAILPATAVGTPVDNASSNSILASRAAQNIGGVYICENINWGGKCGYAVQPLNTCIKLGSDWKDKISSFGPDQCTQCKGWLNDHCESYSFPGGSPTFLGFWTFNYPGDASGGIGTFEPWNDRIESFQCTQVSC